MQIINYNKHFVDSKDIKAVTNSLKGKSLTQGKELITFEKNLKKKFKANFCLAVSSGTAALHLSLLALKLKRKDIVCSSPISFLAGANMVHNCGGKNVFIDIDPKTNNIDPDRLEKFLSKKKIKAVMATDYGGYPCDWKKLKYLSKKYNFYLINDNCHAIGSKYFGDIGYAAKYADLVTHSYHAIKNITTGEGGSILTNNKFFYEKIKILRNHGLLKVSKNLDNSNWPFKLNAYGFNYRLTDLQSALGSSQLKKLTKFCKKRNFIAKIYSDTLKNNKFIELPENKNYIYNSFHLFPIKIHFSKLKLNKKLFINKLKKKGIIIQVHYYPINKHKLHKGINYNIKLNQTNQFHDTAVSLPIFYSLTKNKVHKICKIIDKVINNYKKK